MESGEATTALTGAGQAGTEIGSSLPSRLARDDSNLGTAATTLGGSHTGAATQDKGKEPVSAFTEFMEVDRKWKELKQRKRKLEEEEQALEREETLGIRCALVFSCVQPTKFFLE